MNSTERSELDAEARRQVLLTRIAYERETLRREIVRVREASTLPQLLRSAFGRSTKSSVLGAAASAAADGWLSTGLAWLRRYRMASTLFASVLGSAAPLMKQRGGIKRIVMFGALGVAAYAAFQAWRGMRGGADDSGV